MTDRKELEGLAGAMRLKGATVTIDHDGEGYIHRITIAGAKGIGPLPMTPISSAERMREFLFKNRPRILVHDMTPPLPCVNQKRLTYSDDRRS
ncbi:MAG: hypothetical protein Q7U76_12970 [Nitrospirota bacterium]|nr:hypothetical protein [Nitrospirota bacterium]